MPPKPKCTKEDIIKAAFDMARINGMESVTARELGKRLGTSATPIFTHFKNMHEVELEVRELAIREFENYIADALNYSPAFKQFGMGMVQFAKEEPRLFQLIYMQEHDESQKFDDIFDGLGNISQTCMTVLQRDYAITEEQAYNVFRQVWMHTFSICVFEASKICHFTEDEISQMLSMEFQATLMLVKSGKYKPISPRRD